MPTSPRTSTLTSFLLLCLATAAALGAAALGLMAVPAFPGGLSPLTDGQSVAVAPAGQVLEARRGKRTKGQLRQLALHLSKMHGGQSIGGFPGFEPPDDDDVYRRKIKDRSYSPQDANDWVKEINNFLRIIAKDNPGLSLEEILAKSHFTRSGILRSGQIERLRCWPDGSKCPFRLRTQWTGIGSR